MIFVFVGDLDPKKIILHPILITKRELRNLIGFYQTIKKFGHKEIDVLKDLYRLDCGKIIHNKDIDIMIRLKWIENIYIDFKNYLYISKSGNYVEGLLARYEFLKNPSISDAAIVVICGERILL